MTQDEKVTAALEIQFNSDAGNEITIREYLYRLLMAVWVEEDGFSGKRPFGNSGWKYDLYVPLVEAGIVKGSLDEDGYVEKIDEPEADRFVRKLIRTVFYPAKVTP